MEDLLLAEIERDNNKRYKNYRAPKKHTTIDVIEPPKQRTFTPTAPVNYQEKIKELEKKLYGK